MVLAAAASQYGQPYRVAARKDRHPATRNTVFGQPPRNI
jgi:hypothetical protein